MKVQITFEADSPAQAREILKAVEKLAGLPYRLDGYGTTLMTESTPVLESTEDWTLRPVGTPASRVGQETVQQILAAVPGDSLEINHKMGRPPSSLFSTSAALALLVARGTLQFNGLMYRRAQ